MSVSVRSEPPQWLRDVKERLRFVDILFMAFDTSMTDAEFRKRVQDWIYEMKPETAGFR